MPLIDVVVLRVFTDEQGGFGSPLGVVDGAAAPDAEHRQQIAAELGCSETVFIDDVERAEFRIFTPEVELPFAGHPCIGIAGFLTRELGRHPDTLRPPAGNMATWADGELSWVRGLLAATPPWWHERIERVADVAALTGPLSPEQDAVQIWAWDNEPAGVVRARVFAKRFGVTEDEACGSASMRLAAALGRPLVIRHGQGSIVYAQPGPAGYAEIGGRVTSDGAIQLSI